MNAIKEWRKKNKLTLERAASIVGLKAMTIWRHENGHRSVSSAAAKRYYTQAKIPLNELLEIKKETTTAKSDFFS